MSNPQIQTQIQQFVTLEVLCPGMVISDHMFLCQIETSYYFTNLATAETIVFQADEVLNRFYMENIWGIIPTRVVNLES